MYISLSNLIGDNGAGTWKECLVLLPVPPSTPPKKKDN